MTFEDDQNTPAEQDPIGRASLAADTMVAQLMWAAMLKAPQERPQWDLPAHVAAADSAEDADRMLMILAAESLEPAEA